MLIQRQELLDRLTTAATAFTSQMTVEQSDCFLFIAGEIVVFNNDILIRVPCPAKLPDFAVKADEFLKLLEKLPDDQIDLSVNGGELLVKSESNRRSAGLSVQQKIISPLSEVEKPKGWSDLPEGTFNRLAMAARVCGNDVSQYLTVTVHVTPKRIEALGERCHKMLRIDGDTGFQGEMLLLASRLISVSEMGLNAVSVGNSWCHFKGDGLVASLTYSQEPYFDNPDSALKLEGEPQTLVLPSNLGEIVQRATVFKDVAFDAKVEVALVKGELQLSTRNERGWYRETKSVKYTGPDLSFMVDPKLLLEVLNHTREVQTDGKRMKLAYDNVQFVILLKQK